MRPLTKVIGSNQFELLYRIRKKEADGWKRGRIRHETTRVKHFASRGKYREYAGDDISQKYVCWMWKEDKKCRKNQGDSNAKNA